LQPLRKLDWVVYAKRPFAGPQQVLDYLGRYTHRVAIANSPKPDNELLDLPTTEDKVIGADQVESKENALAKMIEQENARLEMSTYADVKARRMRGRCVAGDLRMDWKDLIAFKRSFTDPVPRKREAGFARQGISAYHGAARFCGPDMVEVNGSTLKGRHIVIASGARPASLSFPGAEHLTLSDAFMELERLPERIVMVGGGYIAAEFSHVAARACKKHKVDSTGTTRF
jgi:hypothetical protein